MKRSLLLLPASLALVATASTVEPATPLTRAAPSVMPALPAPKVSLAQMLEKLPGEWKGEQRMQNPKKQIMTMRVGASYRWETGPDGVRALIGETSYAVGSGDKAKSFRGVSRTWIDAAGKGHAEVTESGKTLRYDALVSEDSLVFIPAGKGEKADSGTGVRIVREGDTECLLVRGFQRAADGVYVVEGKLIKAATATAEAAASK